MSRKRSRSRLRRSAGTRPSRAITGGIETRTVTVFHDIAGLQNNHQWPALKSLVMVEEPTGNPWQGRNRDAFLHRPAHAARRRPGTTIRSRWIVESGVHWALDMIFRDDECRRMLAADSERGQGSSHSARWG
jgi:hypothetical protein